MAASYRRKSRLHSAVTVVGIAIGALSIGAVPAAAAAPVSVAAAAAMPGSITASCRTVFWGSLPKAASGMSTQPIVGVRTGRHPCFDRVVVDLAGSGTGQLGFDVRYVTAVHREGSGAPVPLRGGADIQIIVRAPAYNVDTGAATFRPANPNDAANLAGYPTLRQLAYAGSFEGQTTFGLGVRARLPMRVFVLSGPGSGHRLVIDVYRKW